MLTQYCGTGQFLVYNFINEQIPPNRFHKLYQETYSEETELVPDFNQVPGVNVNSNELRTSKNTMVVSFSIQLETMQ